jgi:membrane-associated phospholipid phosphatase
LLRNKQNLLFYYILFFILGEIFNTFIIGIIQERRPSIDKKTFELMMKNKERYINKNGFPYDIFGMPSGHSQSVFYSTIFIYLTLNNIKITMFYIFISIMTCFQRIIFTHHTILQVIVGSLLGLFIGYFVLEMVKKKIEGKLSMKKDDFAYV